MPNPARKLLPVAGLALALLGCELSGPPKELFDPPDASYRPIHNTALHGKVEGVRRMLAEGASTDAASEQGDTPLLLAIRRGHEEVVEVLLAAGADVSKANKKGTTPLAAAVAYHQPALLERLVQAGAKVEGKTGLDALMLACFLDDAGALRRLLELNPALLTSVDPTRSAAQPKSKDSKQLSQEALASLMVILCLSDLSGPSYQALFDALADPVLASPRSPPAYAGMLLYMTLLRGDYPRARALLAGGLSPDVSSGKDGGTVLHMLAKSKHKAEKPKAGPWKFTGDPELNPVAAKRGGRPYFTPRPEDAPGPFAGLDAIEFLLAHGADPELPAKGGKTALDLARESGDPEVYLALRMARAARRGALREVIREP